MLEITERMVGVYLDVMAVITILGLVIISRRIRSRNTAGDQIFFIMCINVMAYAIFSIASLFIPRITPEQYQVTFIIIKTLIELIVLNLGYQWLLFVGFTIYNSPDYLRRRFWPFFIPIPISAVLFLVNIFTGILFTMEGYGGFRFQAGYYVIVAVEAVYLGFSGWLVWKNNRHADRMHHFHLAPILFPIAAGTVETAFAQITNGPLSFTLGPMGFAAGITFILFTMTERWQYDDETRGFFNRAYLSYMEELAAAGKKDYKSAILLSCSGSEDSLADLIRRELPKEMIRVHFDGGRFALFAETDNESMYQMISSVLSEATAEHDQKNPDAPLELKIRHEKRKKGEECGAFFNRVGAY